MKKLLVLIFILFSFTAHSKEISEYDYDSILFGYGDIVTNGTKYTLNYSVGEEYLFEITGNVDDPLYEMITSSLKKAVPNEYGNKEIAIMYSRYEPVCATDFLTTNMYITGVVEKNGYYVILGSEPESSFKMTLYVDKRSYLGGKMRYRNLGLEGKVHFISYLQSGELIDLFEINY